MRDTMIVALEASFELDPFRMEKKLWGAIDENDKIYYNSYEIKRKVEYLSNKLLRTR